MEPLLTGEGLGDIKALEFRDCHQPSRFCRGKGMIMLPYRRFVR